MDALNIFSNDKDNKFMINYVTRLIFDISFYDVQHENGEYFTDGPPIILGGSFPYSMICRMEPREENSSLFEGNSFDKIFEVFSTLKFEHGEKIYFRGNREEYLRLSKLKEENLGTLKIVLESKLEKDLEYYRFVDEIKSLSDQIFQAKPRLELLCNKDTETFRQFLDIATFKENIPKCSIM